MHGIAAFGYSRALGEQVLGGTGIFVSALFIVAGLTGHGIGKQGPVHASWKKAQFYPDNTPARTLAGGVLGLLVSILLVVISGRAV